MNWFKLIRFLILFFNNIDLIRSIACNRSLKLFTLYYSHFYVFIYSILMTFKKIDNYANYIIERYNGVRSEDRWSYREIWCWSMKNMNF